ncbi:NAD(P)/FAD-dependent oxidoreductase [Sphingomonas sp. 10B4]|uniref:NAD(P)/FAD-dependent oxidoreductase n=1 Tax=Sphingomonas sp. 10B4 TaxID=3048575 RepID=UPI002AB5B999|nr:NAD(P)/FAD-dependent oxidoreductase [Sphingomonas sp. 10B4]MDY7524546.1 NAD(P)/FAD-dependent oxidoreductase [Sphingomonas sp. 10B4]MEB0283757.1 NAD(P)/FAD-dependent oxidoreductase [Sphingomonas sp. 10B4]
MPTLDCLIIGGGPAGLTAALYLARFKRRVVVIDGGWSRAEWITLSHNIPGFPEGISGPTYHDRLRQQAQLYGCAPDKGYVRTLRWRDENGFLAELDSRTISAQTVILATGVVENKPPVPHLADAVKRGLIRTCPICDGYESRDERIAVLGNGPHAAAEALFLRTYSSKLTLLLVGDAALPYPMHEELIQNGIEILQIGSEAIEMQEHGVAAFYAADGQSHSFDVVYTAFGTTAQSDLAASLGARMDDAGRLFVSAHQETSVTSLYAAGDLVRGLNQISVANGEAAIAATAVHNALAMVPAA